MKIRLSKVYEAALNRPQGYVDDVLSYGLKVDGGEWVEIPDDDYVKLLEKYRAPHQPPQPQQAQLDVKDKNTLSTLDKVRSLAKASTEWTKSGFPIPDSETFNARLETCKGCEFWDESGFANTGRCKKCGCSTQAKLRMATEKCPIGKW